MIRRMIRVRRFYSTLWVRVKKNLCNLFAKYIMKRKLMIPNASAVAKWNKLIDDSLRNK